MSCKLFIDLTPGGLVWAAGRVPCTSYQLIVSCSAYGATRRIAERQPKAVRTLFRCLDRHHHHYIEVLGAVV